MHGYSMLTRNISSCLLLTVSTTEWRDIKEGAMYIEASSNSSILWSSLWDSLSSLLLGLLGMASWLGTVRTVGGGEQYYHMP